MRIGKRDWRRMSPEERERHELRCGLRAPLLRSRERMPWAGSGNGWSNGSGYGSGNGRVYGRVYGRGNGDGDGYGNGRGDGFGHGSGNGRGSGDGASPSGRCPWVMEAS